MTRSKSYRLRESQWDAYHKFEREQLKKEKRSFKEALKIFEAMWEEALSLGVIKIKRKFHPEDIKHKIRMAKILNSV